MASREIFSRTSVDEIRALCGKVEWKCTQTATKPYNCALVPMSFDIETTNEYMYIWTFSIYDRTYYGYTFFDLKVLMGLIRQAIGLGKVKVGDKKKATRVVPVFVHNFGAFEWHFIKEELKITDKFLRGSEYDEKGNPLDPDAMFAVAYDSFLFVDSMQICPKMSLEDLAKIYCKTQKTHDLDYKVARNHEDAKHLSNEEMDYCCNDTLILTEFAEYVFDAYFKKYDKLPMTQNQIVSSAITKAFEAERLSISDDKALKALKDFYDDEFLDQKTYRFIREYGFRGGYCGSSYRYFKGRVGYGDLDAAYTFAVVHCYYPRGRYTPIKDPSLWKTFINTHCCQLKVRFTNLRAKEKWLLYDMKHHVFTKNRIECDDSGKVSRVYGTCIVSLNEIHLKMYKLLYDWDNMEVLELKIADRGQLPKPVIEAILNFYKEKSVLKKSCKEDTQEYKRVKTLPSTVSGAMAKRVYGKDLDVLSRVDWYTKYHGIKLRPQWGCYVTAHVRKIIVEMILKLGYANWLYSDTDSIYYVWSEETQAMFDEYNKKVRKMNHDFCKENGYSYLVLCDLGTFDDKRRKHFRIDEFITTGAKSYAYHYYDDKHPEGKYEIVMAGIPDEAVKEAWKESGLSFEEFFCSPYQKIKFTRKTSKVVHNTKAIINGEEMVCKCGVRIKEDPIEGTIRMIKNKLAFEAWQDKVNDDLEYSE